MAYDGTDNFSQWDVTRPANTEQGNVLGVAIQEVKRVVQAVVELEHNSDGSHQAGSIVQSYIANDAVGTDQIADGAVTADKLAANIVDSGSLADGAVGTTQLADDAVTNAKLAANAVETTSIANSAVTPTKLGGATANGQILVGQVAGGWNAVTMTGDATISETGVVSLASVLAIDVAIIQDIKNNGVDGGTFTSGSFVTRDLNSLSDPGSLISLSANKFSIPPGQYIIWAEVPAYVTGDHQAILYNETASFLALSGSSSSNASTDLIASRSIITGFMDLSTSTDPTQFSIKHQCTTTEASDGFGKASSFSGATEVYTQVMVIKVG